MGKIHTLWQIGRTFGLRDGLLRFEYELQRGSGIMSRRMKAAETWNSWKLSQIAPKSTPEDLLNTRRQGAHPFFFADCRTFSVKLKKILGPQGETSVLAEANNILEGKLPFFGRLSFDCGFPPRWFENPKTGKRVSPDRPWTKMRFASDDYGDLKFILEPSRFLFAYPLIRAYALSNDDRFPEAFWSAIESWAGKNPPMSGPLWICGQESSLRIMAWSFAFYAFLHSPVTTPRRASLLLSMIAAHAWRTVQTVGYAQSQRSNHLISEAVGLWTAGTLYPELGDAAAWQAHGAKLLEEAVFDQITPQGAYLQDSFNYQRMILHQLLWTLQLADIHKIELDPQIRARTRSAFQFIGKFVDSISGHAPNHGSNDGSHILPLASSDYGDFRPLMRLGSIVLKVASDLQSGPWDESALWLCNDRSHADVGKSAVQNSSLEPLNSETGYHRIGRPNSWAFVRAGHYTRRPFQADQLHVDLWWRGLNLARDAGTYLYNGQPPWDNGFARTAVHNTVTVDGRDQMRRAGRFLWLDWAQASGKSGATKNTQYPDYFEGEHNGYRSLGITHKRTVQCITEDAWVIVDDLDDMRVRGKKSDLKNSRDLNNEKGDHELRLHWLLPNLPFQTLAESPFSAVMSADNAHIRWNIFSSSKGSAAIFRAGKCVAGDIPDTGSEILGWDSPTYGELRPATSIVYQLRAAAPVRMVTAILADDALELRHSQGQVVLSRDAELVFQIRLTPIEPEPIQP